MEFWFWFEVVVSFPFMQCEDIVPILKDYHDQLLMLKLLRVVNMLEI